MRRIALQTANLAKSGKNVSNVDDADKTQTVPEKRADGKTGGELSLVAPVKGVWVRNNKIGWTDLLLTHQFC